MSEIKKLAGQTAIYGLSSIVGRLLNYLLVPLYTRVFDKAEYGVVSEMYAWVAFMMIVFTYGMETAFFHFSQKEADKEKVYGTSLFSIISSSVFLCLVLIFFSQPLANLIGYPKHSEYITLFALILSFDALCALPFAKLRQQNKAKAFAGIKFINILLNICFNLFFLVICPYAIKTDAGLLTQIANSVYSSKVGVGYVFVSNLLSSGITFLMLLKYLKDVNLKPDFSLLKQMLAYGAPLLIAGFAGMTNETFDRAIYKHLAPNPATALAELGVYSACYKLSIIMTLFIQTFRYAAEPFFFAQHKNENKQQVYALVMKYFVITCSFIFAAVMLYIDAVKYFIGEEFRSGLGVVPVLLLANLFLGVFYTLSMWYKLAGKTYYGAWFSIFGAVLTVILLLVMIPLWGYMGAAWATLITYAAMMVASYFTGQKNYFVPYDTARCLMYIGLAVLTWFASAGILKMFSPGTVASFFINTLLLFLFAAFIFFLEKPKVKM